MSGPPVDEVEVNASAVEAGSTFRDLAVQDWSKEDVSSWLKEQGPFSEEAEIFEANNITGRSITCIEKSDLKEMGISMGKRLELFQTLKELGHPKTSYTPKEYGEGNILWKKKVTRNDRAQWNPKQKTLYLEKMAVLNREAATLWPGNVKVHVKADATERLKLEELVTRMEETCSIPHIGFGRGQSQASQEGQATITDSSSDTTVTTTGDESDGESTSDATCDYQPSTDIEDMTMKSGRAVILQVFNANSIQLLTVRNHFLPLGKALHVKCRSLGKYEMILPLAKALIAAGYVEIETAGGDVNYRNILRKDVKVTADFEQLLY